MLPADYFFFFFFFLFFFNARTHPVFYLTQECVEYVLPHLAVYFMQ